MLFCGLNSCSENPVNENTTELISEETPALFPPFESFPENQFYTLAIGDSKESTTEKLKTLPIERIADEEVSYFNFPSDSTELIIPKTSMLTEFTVFLKGDFYLNKQEELIAFFEERANDNSITPTLSIFHFYDVESPFKLSFFQQSKFIRLRFEVSGRNV